jgi:DNA invertase Pin-like site-specific DNA recombinase
MELEEQMTDNGDVISLLRVSTAEQATEGRSGIERQRQINSDGARFHRVRIIREIEAVDVSGRHVKFDPDFQKLFHDLRTSPIRGVIVSEQSRIFRPENFSDFAILEEFRANHKLIYTPQSVIDPNTDEGWMSLIMNGMMSGQELRRIRERMVSGKQRDRKAGKHPSGPHLLPRGVRYIRPLDAEGRVIRGAMGRWEYDGVDSERVKRMFELFLAGRTYEDIAVEVGGGWSGCGVKKTLQNPIWIGTRAYRYKSHEYTRPGEAKPRRRSIPREDPLEVGIALDPLVSREAFERVQEMMERRAHQWRKRKLKNSHRARFLLAGLGRCACGKTLYHSYGSRRESHGRYYCSSQRHGPRCEGIAMRRDCLEEAVERAVSEQLTNRSVLKTILARAMQSEPQQDSDAKATLKRLQADIKKRRQRVIQNFEDGDISRDQKRDKLNALAAELHRLELEAGVTTMPRHTAKDICQQIVEVFQDFKRLPFERKRDLLFRAVREIIIDTRNRNIPMVILNGNWLAEAGANCGEHL